MEIMTSALCISCPQKSDLKKFFSKKKSKKFFFIKEKKAVLKIIDIKYVLKFGPDRSIGSPAN